MFAHQPVIGSNIRLALYAVDNQKLDRFTTGRFDMRGEPRTAQSGYTCITDGFYDVTFGMRQIICHRRQFNPFVFAIRAYTYARFGKPAGVRDYVWRNRNHLTGGGGMNGHRKRVCALCQWLTFSDVITDFHCAGAFHSDMLA